MWMYTLLPKILNMSVTASIVIVLVLAARLLLRRAPKIFSYALWAVVLFRLVCPVSFSSVFSLIGLIQPAEAVNDSAYSSITYIPADIVHTEAPQVDLPAPGVSEAINSSLPRGAEQLAADPLEFTMAAAAILWLAGIGGMLVYSAVSLIRLRRRLIGAVRLRDNIYLADHIDTPFVIGVFRPKIYLPSTLREDEQSYVILHEQTHIRRLDHLVKMLAFLALAVHWFNPLVWAAFVFAVKDMEMSCDERVLKHIGDNIKSAYSTSLLSLATGRRLMNGSPLAFGEGNLKGRIKNVMSFKKPAAWVIVISVLLVAALSIGFASNGAVNVSDPEGYKSLFRERFAEARKVGLHYTATNCWGRDAVPDFVAGDTEYYMCGHYKSKAELRAATEAVFTKNLAEGFYSKLDSEAFLERDGRLYIAPRYLYDASVWQAEDTISFKDQTTDTFLWDTLTVTKTGDSIVSYTMDWYQTFPGDPLTSSFTLVKGEDGVWRFDECFGDFRKTPEMAYIELQTFISEDTDLVKLGTFAFTTYMDYLSSEGMPVEERIASYKLNEISVLAGDINEFCVALNYDITTDSDSYLNPALGARGKGTWPDNYMEIRVVKYDDDNVYSIKSVGTGGGAQGLVPYSMAFDYGGLHLQVTYVGNVRTEGVMDGDGVGIHEYTVFACYPGAVLKVLDADMSDPAYGEDGKAHPEWAIATTASDMSGERIYITDGMEPYEITPDTLGIYDPESSEYVLRFEMAGAAEASPGGAGGLITQSDVNQVVQGENIDLGKFEKGYTLVAFVDDTLSEAEAQALQSRIEQTPNVVYTEFVTREEAYQRFEAKYEDKSVFEGIDPSILRHRYVVYIQGSSLIEQTVKEIIKIEGIASVIVSELSDELSHISFAVSPSDRFSESEISSAMECVILKFRDFEGCKLTKLWYDEEKSDDYVYGGNSAISGVSKENVIVLYSDFTVDSSGGDGSLNPNSTYTDWMWILIRDSKEGAWRVHNWGY